MLVFLTGIFLIIFLLYLYLQNLFLYWTRRKVKTFHPSFLLGNMGPILMGKKQFGVYIKDLYNRINEPYFGFYIFGRPALVIKNPDLIRAVMVKNHQHFDHRGLHLNENKNAFNLNLFTLSGEKWKIRRSTMSPAFTSGKLKNMLSTITKCGENLQKYLEGQAKKDAIIEVKDLAARYTTDVIASTAFGTESNSIMDPNDEFRKMGRKLTELGFIDGLKQILFFAAPEVLNKLKLKTYNEEVANFLTNIVRQTIEYRETSKVIRNDFMQILLELRNNGKISENNENFGIKNNSEKKMSVTQMASECYLFFIAGFDTSSNIISSALYELALQPNLLRRVQEDVDEQVAKYGGFTYEALMDMKYLDAVQYETSRKYPALTFISRKCTQDYKVPDSELVIEKGTFIIIPVFALHMNPNYFPNPEHFNPERFMEGVKTTWPSSTFLPFGDGPRICIAQILGKMMVKIALAMMLQKYDFIVCSETPKKIKINPSHVGVTHTSGIYLQLKQRT